MKRCYLIPALLLLTSSIFARTDMTLSEKAELILSRPTSQASSLSYNLLHSREHQRIIQNTVTVNDAEQDEVIFQDWTGSAWKNSERLLFTAGISYEDVEAFLMTLEIADNASTLAFSATLLYSAFLDLLNVTGLTNVLYQLDDGTGTNWIDISRITGTVSGGKVESLLYEEKVDAAWQETGKIDFSYTTGGLVASFILSSILEEGGALAEAMKWENTYDSSNFLTNDAISMNAAILTVTKSAGIDETTWTKLIENEYINNDHGNPTMVTMKFSMLGMMPIADVSRTLNEYHVNQKIARTIYQVPESSGPIIPFKASAAETDWVNSDKDTIIYNANWNVTDIVMTTWLNDVWENFLAVRLEYNTDGLEIKQIIQEWGGAEWVNTDQWITTWKNGLVEKELYQTFEAGNPVDSDQYLYSYSGLKLDNVVHEAKNGDDWEKVDKVILNVTTPVEESRLIASEFSLGNYPNPFNPSTTITYTLTSPGPVQLNIYDVNGRLIRTLTDNVMQSAGTYQIVWDGIDASDQSVASGIYFYRLQTSEITRTKRCLLIK